MLRQFMTLVAVGAIGGFALGQNACAQEALTKKCRMPGTSYDLETASLPICTVTRRSTRPTTPSLPTARGPASVGTPVNTPTRRLTFESYMNSNANHPAFARARVLPQEAFKDWSKPAVISGSTLESETENRTPASAPNSATVGVPNGTTGGSQPTTTIPSSSPAPDPGNR